MVKLKPSVMVLPEFWSRRMNCLNLSYVKKACLPEMPESKSARNTVLNELARRHNIPNANFLRLLFLKLVFRYYAYLFLVKLISKVNSGVNLF